MSSGEPPINMLKVELPGNKDDTENPESLNIVTPRRMEDATNSTKTKLESQDGRNKNTNDKTGDGEESLSGAESNADSVSSDMQSQSAGPKRREQNRLHARNMRERKKRVLVSQQDRLSQLLQERIRVGSVLSSISGGVLYPFEPRQKSEKENAEVALVMERLDEMDEALNQIKDKHLKSKDAHTAEAIRIMRKEKNRIHARMTRLRKKLSSDETDRAIEQLENEILTIMSKIKIFNSSQYAQVPIQVPAPHPSLYQPSEVYSHFEYDYETMMPYYEATQNYYMGHPLSSACNYPISGILAPLGSAPPFPGMTGSSEMAHSSMHWQHAETPPYYYDYYTQDALMHNAFSRNMHTTLNETQPIPSFPTNKRQKITECLSSSNETNSSCVVPAPETPKP